MKKELQCVVALVLAVAALSQAEIVISPWQEIFKGVFYCQGRADINEPQLQFVNALRIDTQAAGIGFFVTPSNGDLPLDAIGQTPGDFLESYNLKVAVNGGFYAPSSNVTNIPDQPKELYGLTVSRGQEVSVIDNFDPRDLSRGATVLWFDRDNNAHICDWQDIEDSGALYNAISAGPMLMKNGEILIAKNDPDENRYIYKVHPRTAAGVSADGRYVYFITINGRQKGYSIGEDLYETAMWLKRLGAWDALNLDGGASATMVRADLLGNQVLLNRPCDAWQRFNGSNIGVFADPLPVEPKDVSDLIAVDTFDYDSRPYGSADDNTPYGGGLDGLDGGDGWLTPWQDRVAKTGSFAGIVNPSQTRSTLFSGGSVKLPESKFAHVVRYMELSRLPADYLKNGRAIGADDTSVWVAFSAKHHSGDGDHAAYVQLGEDLQLGKPDCQADGSNWSVNYRQTCTVSDIPSNQPTLFLARLSFGSTEDRLELWLNPVETDSEEQLGLPAIAKTLDDFDFYHVSLCGSFGEFDNLRIGRTLESVGPFVK